MVEWSVMYCRIFDWPAHCLFVAAVFSSLEKRKALASRLCHKL